MAIEVVGPLSKAESSIVGEEWRLNVVRRREAFKNDNAVVHVSDYRMSVMERCFHTNATGCIDNTIRLCRKREICERGAILQTKEQYFLALCSIK